MNESQIRQLEGFLLSYLVFYRLNCIRIVLVHIKFIVLLLAFLFDLCFCFFSLITIFLILFRVWRLIALSKTFLCYLCIWLCLNCIYLIQLLGIIQILSLKAVSADRKPNKHSNYQNCQQYVRKFASFHSYRILIYSLLSLCYDCLCFLLDINDWYRGRNYWWLSFFGHFQKYSFGVIFTGIFNLVVKLIVLVNIEVLLVFLNDLLGDHLVRYVKDLNLSLVLFLHQRPDDNIYLVLSFQSGNVPATWLRINKLNFVGFNFVHQRSSYILKRRQIRQLNRFKRLVRLECQLC